MRTDIEAMAKKSQQHANKQEYFGGRKPVERYKMTEITKLNKRVTPKCYDAGMIYQFPVYLQNETSLQLSIP